MSPFTHLKTETDPVSEMSLSIYLGYRMTDKFDKGSDRKHLVHVFCLSIGAIYLARQIIPILIPFISFQISVQIKRVSSSNSITFLLDHTCPSLCYDVKFMFANRSGCL
jgi:hypothetical protein